MITISILIAFSTRQYNLLEIKYPQIVANLRDEWVHVEQEIAPL